MGLYACPYESPVALEPGPVEPVDSSLLGYWYGIVKDGSDFFGVEALDITQQSDSVYAITRYGKAVKGDIILPDTAHFTGYTSYVEGQRFMNVEGSIVIVNKRRNKPPEVKTQKLFYLASLTLRNDTVTIKTITENFSPDQKVFNDREALKKAVTQLITEKKNIYDDVYSLAYRKIQRPQPLKSF